MNKYLKNLSKIEFVITDACTGKCKHCSEGDHLSCGERIDPQIAADAVRKISSQYNIKTVMTFGGEPLLYTDAVYAIMKAAKDLNIPKRQLITNGYFTKSLNKMSEVAKTLANCGVNDLLLSVDAFHQETIPLDVVKAFAKEVIKYKIPIRLSPAWLVCKENENPYNNFTRQILNEFSDLKIEIGEGNVVFMQGNAAKFLSSYFSDVLPVNPYVEDEKDVRCVSFAANGDVLDSNVYKQDIFDIIKNYSPKE